MVTIIAKEVFCFYLNEDNEGEYVRAKMEVWVLGNTKIEASPTKSRKRRDQRSKRKEKKTKTSQKSKE